MSKQIHNTSALLLRIGLAIVFLYACLASVKNPQDWVGYMPHVLTKFISASILLRWFALYELALALWLLSGRYVRYAAALSVLTFVGIIASNLHLFAITFRDIGLLFAALALLFSKSSE